MFETTTARTIGMDIGDKYAHLHVLEADGTLAEETRIATTKAAVSRYFSRQAPTRARWT